jgi:hypothetical protein
MDTPKPTSKLIKLKHEADAEVEVTNTNMRVMVGELPDVTTLWKGRMDRWSPPFYSISPYLLYGTPVLGPVLCFVCTHVKTSPPYTRTTISDAASEQSALRGHAASKLHPPLAHISSSIEPFQVAPVLHAHTAHSLFLPMFLFHSYTTLRDLFAHFLVHLYTPYSGRPTHLAVYQRRTYLFLNTL